MLRYNGGMHWKIHVYCFLLTYLLALGLEFSRLLGWNMWSRFVALAVGLAGLAAHTLYLLGRSQDTQLPPLLSSAHDWVLVLAWVLVAMSLVLAISRGDLPVGAFVLPVVLVLIGSTFFLAAPASLVNESERVQALRTAHRVVTMSHASSLVLGMVSVAAGLISAVMYLVKHHQLKARHAEHEGWRMPSLERLAAVNRWSVILAFLALTIGMLTGVFLGFRGPRTTEPAVRYSDPLVVGSLVVYVALTALVLWQLTHRQQSGRQVAWLTACACGFLLLTLIGLPLLLRGSGFHERGATSSPPRLTASQRRARSPGAVCNSRCESREDPALAVGSRFNDLPA